MLETEHKVSELADFSPLPAERIESRVGKDDGDQWAVLAGMRFVLAIIVACAHTIYVLGVGDTLPRPLMFLKHLGAAEAVVGFFLISGYSISASIARDRVNYAARRVWRIWPVYFCCALYGLAPFFIAHGEFGLMDGTFVEWPIFSLLFMTMIGLPFLFTQAYFMMAVSWSLVCEFVYYAAAPLLDRMTMRGLAIIGCLSLAVYAAITGLIRDLDHVRPGGIVPVSLAWLWILGFAFQRYRHHKYAAALMVALPLTFFVLPPVSPYGRVTLLLVGAGLIIAPSVSLSPVIARMLNFLGDVSYPLYLSHISTMCALYLIAPRWMAAHSSLYLLAALCVAVVITILIDYPTRRYASYRAKRKEKAYVLAGSST